tara:strand:+ start:1350 stop:2081 length:732 start_codon:yes stop_codon:yes gene_type:complete
MNNSEKEMPFWEHIEELRWCLIKIVLAIMICSFISFYNWELFLKFLLIPSNSLDMNLNLQVLKITSMFIIKISCSILIGIIFSLPIILYQIWSFINPALSKNFRFSIIFFSIFGSFFFIIGISFGYFILVPFSLSFFSGIVSNSFNVEYNFTLDNYLYFVLWLSFISGLIFQLPVVSFYLTKIGLLTTAFLKHYRKYAYLFFLVLAAILTPPDPFSQIIVAVPLFFLYELSIIISLFYKNSYE